MLKWVSLLVLVAAGAGTAWLMAGRQPGPVIEITEPAAIGQMGELVVNIDTPRGVLNSLQVTLEQGDRTLSIFSFPGDDALGLV